jgi:SAM-dependent methyltransferase
VDELGPLEGRLLHFRCQLGLDTLDIARLHPTVEVIGLDASRPSIERAISLAAELKLSDRATFAVTDVDRLAEVDVLDGQTFNVVYTGKGALSRVPDLDQWAEVVRDLLVPDGFLYISEYHPVIETLDNEQPVPVFDYFHSGPFEDDAGYWWIQPMARVLTALIRAGFHLQVVHEWDEADQPIRPWLVKGSDGRWHWPDAAPGTLPVMYSVKALRPPR